jgi:hypothetical protein
MGAVPQVKPALEHEAAHGLPMGAPIVRRFCAKDAHQMGSRAREPSSALVRRETRRERQPFEL